MNNELWHNKISLRRHTPDDLPFLEALYASTRETELSLTDFTPSEKLAFVRHQFQAQYQHYTQHYNSDNFDIIEINNSAIGRLFVDHWDSEIRIVDISLVPDYQNQGLGSYLFKQIFSQAISSNKSVTIHVEHNNPAKKLYERLGFAVKNKTNEIYLLMQWMPS